jgi:hypothetical protein
MRHFAKKELLNIAFLRLVAQKVQLDSAQQKGDSVSIFRPNKSIKPRFMEDQIAVSASSAFSLLPCSREYRVSRSVMNNIP